MNPASIVKLMSAKNKFEAAHPKFIAFLQAMFARGIEEGTVIEIRVTKPGQDTVTANIKVKESDLELLQELQNMRG